MDAVLPVDERRATHGPRAVRSFGWHRRYAIVAIAAFLLLSAAVFAVPRVTEILKPLPGSPPGSVERSGPVAGEAYRWRPVTIGGGGFVTGIATDARGDTRVIRTDVYGAYIWDAAADRWQQLVTADRMPPDNRVQNALGQGVYEIAVAPGDRNRLYMALNGRFYRSDDRGGNWHKQADVKPFPMQFDPNSEFRLYGPFIAVSPDNPDLVLFGTPYDGLWISRDGAKQWSHVDSVPAGGDLRAAPGVQAPGHTIWFAPDRNGTAPRRILVASPAHGVFVSRDNGASFVPLAPGARAQPIGVAHGAFGADGAFFAADPEARKLWRFRDGVWLDLSVEGLPDGDFLGVAADPRNHVVYATDAGGHAWCSSADGSGWRRLWRSAGPGEREPPWLRLNNEGYFAMGQLSFDPVMPNRLWAAAGTGPYFADEGEGCPLRLPWTSQVRGIEELVANDAVQPPGHAPLFVAWDFGINLKPDLDVFSTTFGPRERLLISTQQVDWSPSDPAFLVTNASDTRMNCCSEDGNSILAGYSTDGGRSWSKFASLPQPPGTAADDPWRMAFGGIAVSADSTRNIVWEPAFSRSPFFTEDGGATWTRVRFPGETLPNTGSYDKYWISRRTLAADRVLPGTFYLLHTGGGANEALRGLWRTRNRGHSWERVLAGEIAPGNADNAKLRVVVGHAGHLFYTAGIGYGSDTHLRRSFDGGAHWQADPRVEAVDDIAFGKAAAGQDYPALYLSGKVDGVYGLWRSIDNAAHWQRLAGFPLGRLDKIAVVEADKDVFGRLYVGYKGSGWIYGEPAVCKPVAGPVKEDSDCTAIARRR